MRESCEIDTGASWEWNVHEDESIETGNNGLSSAIHQNYLDFHQINAKSTEATSQVFQISSNAINSEFTAQKLFLM